MRPTASLPGIGPVGLAYARGGAARGPKPGMAIGMPPGMRVQAPAPPVNRRFMSGGEKKDVRVTMRGRRPPAHLPPMGQNLELSMGQDSPSMGPNLEL